MSSRRQPEFITHSLVIIDLCVINIIAILLHFLINYISVVQQVTLLVGINISWFIAAIVVQAYHIRNSIAIGSIVSTVAKASFIHMTGVTFIYCYVCGTAFPRRIFSIYIIATFFVLFLSRFLFSRFLRRLSKRGYRYKNAIIVGMGVEAKRLKRFIKSSQSFGINFMGYVAKDESESSSSGISFFDTFSGGDDSPDIQNKPNNLVQGSQAAGAVSIALGDKLQITHLEKPESLSTNANPVKSRMNTDYLPNFSTNILGVVDDLESLIVSGKVDNIYWTLPTSEDFRLKKVVDLCEKHMVRFYRVPNYLSLPFRNLDVDTYGGLPVLHYRNEPLENLFNRFVKRSFDIIFAILVIVLVLSWLIPLVWILMKFTMPGPVFFAQDRSGKNNTTFRVLKFRSMKVNKDSDKVQATKDDNRITKLGSFLRKSSLDEMPQFINVLLGHMTVVGPRPHMLKHTEEYSEKINDFMVRHLIKPGITGWAQVKGFRGGTETLAQMEGRVEHDVWYLENWSFWLDLKIVIKTVTNALGGEENAY